MKQLKTSLMLLLTMTLLTGVLYPLGVTAISKLFFRHEAEGSLILQDGKVVGSELIGQNFDDPRYLWGRLSATAPAYNASSSSGSNLGPLNPVLIDNAKSRISALSLSNTTPIPIDLITSSASGLDPHVSPEAAEVQVQRIVKAGGISESELRDILKASTEERIFGFLGDPRVNVLKVNLNLHRLYAVQK